MESCVSPILIPYIIIIRTSIVPLVIGLNNHSRTFSDLAADGSFVIYNCACQHYLHRYWSIVLDGEKLMRLNGLSKYDSRHGGLVPNLWLLRDGAEDHNRCINALSLILILFSCIGEIMPSIPSIAIINQNKCVTYYKNIIY